jgi:hypothetical protein
MANNNIPRKVTERQILEYYAGDDSKKMALLKSSLAKGKLLTNISYSLENCFSILRGFFDVSTFDKKVSDEEALNMAKKINEYLKLNKISKERKKFERYFVLSMDGKNAKNLKEALERGRELLEKNQANL